MMIVMHIICVYMEEICLQALAIGAGVLRYAMVNETIYRSLLISTERKNYYLWLYRRRFQKIL